MTGIQTCALPIFEGLSALNKRILNLSNIMKEPYWKALEGFIEIIITGLLSNRLGMSGDNRTVE